MTARKRKTKTHRTPPRRRWTAALLAFGFGLSAGVLLPWVVWLDQYAAARFVERQWKQAGRVYARPLEIYAGRILSRPDFEFELRSAGLRALEPLLPGRFRRQPDGYLVALPALEFSDGRQSAVTLRVAFNASGISEVTDTSGQSMGVARLPPAELGSLLPMDERDRTVVPIDGFPTLLVAGVQAVEDRQFARHHGVDPRAIVRALYRNVVSGQVVQGGSTITQQLVKNLFLSAEQRLIRKLNEAVMAISLEFRFSKAEILETYLNEVFLGQDGARAIHGFGRAAEHYFGLPVKALATDQIALLVGMVRGASWYHPTRNPQRALARRNLVLDIFRDTGLITTEEHAAARARPLGAEGRQGAAGRAHPAFMDLLRRQLRADYRDADLRETGLKIHTTISPSAQRHAERALSNGLARVDQADGGLQGALVLVQPESGEVRALVGDRVPNRHGFNRALDARRPIGSVIKPFVYLLALADPDSFSLITPLEDLPIRVPVRGGDDWQPGNYDGQSHGRVPLLQALVQSYNQATVRLGLQIGVPTLFRLLEQLGVAPGVERHPAAFLGSVDLTPLQVAQLYQPIAAGGYSTPLRAITAVLDADGERVARYPMRLRPIQDRGALALIDFALERVVVEGTGRSLSGQLTNARARSATLRGKTGTTSDRRDAWFAGYSEDWLGVVWVGRDDNQPAGISGATTALPVWAMLFDALPHRRHARQWPSQLEWFWVDWPEPLLADRDCPGARALPFIAGSQPQQTSACLDR